MSDPLFLLSVLRGSLDRFLLSHPPWSPSQSTGAAVIVIGSNGETKTHPADEARASGYLFGLNAIGMCTLRLPREAVQVEGRRMQSIILDVSSLLAFRSSTEASTS